jgi:hypothetical protein
MTTWMKVVATRKRKMTMEEAWDWVGVLVLLLEEEGEEEGILGGMMMMDGCFVVML